MQDSGEGLLYETLPAVRWAPHGEAPCLAMIKKHVVFLLGAGSSYGYGYPSGTELKNALCSVEADRMPTLYGAGFTDQQVHDFQRRLRASGLNSVDAFLLRNPS